MNPPDQASSPEEPRHILPGHSRYHRHSANVFDNGVVEAIHPEVVALVLGGAEQDCRRAHETLLSESPSSLASEAVEQPVKWVLDSHPQSPVMFVDALPEDSDSSCRLSCFARKESVSLIIFDIF